MGTGTVGGHVPCRWALGQRLCVQREESRPCCRALTHPQTHINAARRGVRVGRSVYLRESGSEVGEWRCSLPGRMPVEGAPLREASVQAGETLRQCGAGWESRLCSESLLGQKGGRSGREGKVRAKSNRPLKARQETQTCLRKAVGRGAF